MVEPYVKRHYKYPLNIPTYTDPDTRTEYQYDSTGHALYKARKHFMDWSRQHDGARSQDFRDASITDPGYLGVKGAGKGIHDVGGILLSTYILGKMGTGGDAAAIALAALDSKGKSYDDHLKPYMEKSEEEMWKSPVYQEMRQQGFKKSTSILQTGSETGKQRSGRKIKRIGKSKSSRLINP